MEAIWFYEIDGQQRGPLTEEELHELNRSGAIGKENLIWKDGMPDWLSYSAVFDQASTAATSETPPSAMPPAVPESMAPKPPFVPRNARLREDSNPRIFSAMGRGWNLMFYDFGPNLGYFLLVSLILSIAMQLVVPILFLMFPIVAGCYFSYLKKSRGQFTELGDIFEGFKRRFGDLAIVNLATVIPAIVFGAVVGGAMFGGCVYMLNENMPGQSEDVLIVLVIVGGLFLLTLLFGWFGLIGTLASMLCLDCEISAGPALRLAFAGAMRHFFRILLFGFMTIFVSSIGTIAIYIGCLLTSLWMMIATIYIYEDLFGDGKEVAS